MKTTDYFINPSKIQTVMNPRLLPFALVFLVLFNILLMHEGWLIETDLLWHIRTGQDILNSFSFPRIDTYSFSRAGAPWIAKEWLSQIIYTILFQEIGWRGVSIFSAFIVSISLSIFFYASSKFCRPIYLIISIIMLLPSLTLVARPQILSFPILVTALIALDVRAQRELTPPWWLILITALWSNIHASAPLMIVLIVFHIFERIWSVPHSQRTQFSLDWLGFAVLNILALGATPYGFQPLVYALKFSSSEISSQVMEWRSISASLPDFQPIHYIGFIVFPFSILIAGLFLCSRQKIFWPISIRIISFAVAGLLHIRFIQIFDLVAVSAMIKIFSNSNDFQIYSARSNYNEYNRRWIGLLVAGLCATGMWSATFLAPDKPYERFSPLYALNAAREAGLVGRVFNSYDFGGFLIFHQVSTFIDGRAEIFLASVLKDYNRAIQSPDGENMKKLIREYEITWALVISGSDEDRRFSQMENWNKIYSDENATVYTLNQ